MRKWCILGLIIILTSLLSFFIPPPRLVTALPSYGAGAYPYESGVDPVATAWVGHDVGGPIGGGSGYLHYYSSASADYTVTTETQLTNALAAATSGDLIWIPSSTTITISTAYAKLIPSGVILASDRGNGASLGGKIYWTYDTSPVAYPHTTPSSMTTLLYMSTDSIVSGIRIEGPGGIAPMAGWGHIALRGMEDALRIEVENCEISECAWGGIYFKGGDMAWNSSNRHYVHHCYIHNIQRHGYGYGISEEGGDSGYGGCSFLAEANIFYDNRHHIMAQATYAASSYHCNYELRYNHFYDVRYGLDGDEDNLYANQQVDCHGSDTGDASLSAGGTLKIHHNTFENNWSAPNGNYENVRIRGIPKTVCDVYNNWTKQTYHTGVYTETNADNPTFQQTWSGSTFINMNVYDNWYGTTAPTGGTTPPSVETNSATLITATTATLNAELTSLGTAASVQAYFEYGTTTSYGSTTTPDTLWFAVSFGAAIAGLSDGVTYHFRVVAIGDGTSYGADTIFTASGATTPPSVTTNAATSVLESSVTLNGDLTNLGTAGTVTVSFEYGTTLSYGSTTAGQDKIVIGAYTQNLSGLAEDATYYYRAKAVGDGTSYGAAQSFTTTSTGGVEIGSTTLATLAYPYQRRLFFGDGRFWMFYSDGTDFVCRSSSTGETWSESTVIVSGATANSRMTTQFDGTYLHIAYAHGVDNEPIEYRRYTCNGDGTLTASAAWQTAVAGALGHIYYSTSICVDGSGHPVISYIHYEDGGGTFTPYITKANQTDGTWATTAFDTQISAVDDVNWRIGVVATSSDNLMAIYARDAQTVKSKTWDSAWNTENATVSSIEVGSAFSAVVTSDNIVHLVFCADTTENITYTRYLSGGTAWEAEEEVYDGTNANLSPVLAKDNNDNLYCFWLEDPTADHVYYTRRMAGVWDGAPTDWIAATDIVRADYLTCSYQQAPGNYIGLAWLRGTGSPYTIRFDFLEGEAPSYYEGMDIFTLTYDNVCWDTALVNASLSSDNIAVGVRWTTADGLVWDTTSLLNPGNCAPSASPYTNSWEVTETQTDNFTVNRYIDQLQLGGLTYVRFAVQWSDSGYWVYSNEMAVYADALVATVYEHISTEHDSSSETISGNDWSFESVLATDNHSTNFVRVLMYRTGTVSTLTASLYTENTTTFVPEGAALTSGSVDISAITTDNKGEWVVIMFDTEIDLTAGLYYDLVLTQSNVAGTAHWVTTTTGGPGYYAHSNDAGTTWAYDGGPTFRDGLFELWDLSGVGPSMLHIVDIDAESVTVAWQLSSGGSFILVYKLASFPSDSTDGTVVYNGDFTSAVADNLTSGTTYYFGLWSYIEAPCSDIVFLVDTPAYCVATTAAGYPNPNYGDAVGPDTDSSILDNSIFGGLLDFVSTYGELPSGTAGVLGFSSLFVFGIVAMAVYNRSTFAILIFSIAGLALGNSLGVFATVFLVIAVIIGFTAGHLRGGQPSGG